MPDASDPPFDAAAARRLMRAADRAALATCLQAEPQGWPYASLVLVAFDYDATPLLLISDLSEHAKNIAADPRLSLLIDGTAGHEDPLAGPRLSLIGSAVRDDAGRLRRRFVARHPASAVYVGFKDFHLYRIALERAHFVAGFGRIRWIEAREILLPIEVSAFGAAEDIIEPVNEEHADAIDAAARRLTKASAKGWRVTGLDPEGADLRRAGATARIDFAEPQFTHHAAHTALLATLRG
jgi:putative heme iron utilization protein